MRYDFLQVTDEQLDEHAPALADLLTAGGSRTTPGEALSIILRLERSVIRRVPESSKDFRSALAACALLPVDRAAAMLERATGWSSKKATLLLDALSNPEVNVLEPVEGGWRVRDMAERYGRFMKLKKDARARSQHNYRAREAGWEPGDGKEWRHTATGDIQPSLAAVISLLDAQETHDAR